MDSKSHSPAKNLQVDVDCASPTVAGDGSHSSGKASRLFLTSVFALLLLNFAGLSFAFWRLNEQNEELSQLQRIAAVQTVSESSTATLQRRSVSGVTQDDESRPHQSRAHGTHTKPCQHGRCKTGKNDERTPPISLGSAGLVHSRLDVGSTNIPSGHLVLSNSEQKSYTYSGDRPLLFSDGFSGDTFTFLNNMLAADGHLQAQTAGLYFVYAQIFFKGIQSSSAPGLGLYRRNNQVAHALAPNPTDSTAYVGRLICMNQGDMLTVKLGSSISQRFNIGLDPKRSFFGAFSVSTVTKCSW